MINIYIGAEKRTSGLRGFTSQKQRFTSSDSPSFVIFATIMTFSLLLNGFFKEELESNDINYTWWYFLPKPVLLDCYQRFLGNEILVLKGYNAVLEVTSSYPFSRKRKMSITAEIIFIGEEKFAPKGIHILSSILFFYVSIQTFPSVLQTQSSSSLRTHYCHKRYSCYNCFLLSENHISLFLYSCVGWAMF